MKKPDMQKKKNNAGFSLVELLVAMVILAIIVVPILRSFVISAQTNAKAKTTMRATTVAQNVLEGLTANSKEELDAQFGTYSGATFDVVANAEGAKSISTDDVNARYTYGIKGVSFNNVKYDAKITMDGSAYKDATNTDTPDYNLETVTQIYNMDDTKDAFFVQSATATDNPDDLAAQEFASRSNNALTLSAIKTKMYRAITITAKNATVGTDFFTSVLIEYAYRCDDSSIPFDERNIEYSYSIFNNAESGEALRGIYLFYIPNYNSTGSPYKDEILIKNEDNLEFYLYLVKQKSSNALQNLEQNYRMEVDIEETTNSTDVPKMKKVLTNLGRNLADNSKLEQQASFKYTKTSGTVTGEGARNLLGINLDQSTWVNSEVMNRMFDVTIEIYESGAYDSGFAGSEKRLATITGAFQD